MIAEDNLVYFEDVYDELKVMLISYNYDISMLVHHIKQKFHLIDACCYTFANATAERYQEEREQITTDKG